MKIVFSIILISFSSVVHGDCPPGWSNYGGDNCYIVSSSKMTWGEAQEVSYLDFQPLLLLYKIYFSFAGAIVVTWQRL